MKQKRVWDETVDTKVPLEWHTRFFRYKEDIVWTQKIETKKPWCCPLIISFSSRSITLQPTCQQRSLHPKNDSHWPLFSSFTSAVRWSQNIHLVTTGTKTIFSQMHWQNFSQNVHQLWHLYFWIKTIITCLRREWCYNRW